MLLYGASGFMGELIAREAARQGLPVTLAGRTEASLAVLGTELGLPYRVFALDNPDAAQQALGGHRILINASGPFHVTAAPLLRHALNAGVHYLDLAGEVEDFVAVQARDAEAVARGVRLMPGVGFGVFPTDSLAVFLHGLLPDAVRLTLAFETQGGVSQETAQTVLYGLAHGGVARRGGALRPVPAAWKRRRIEFGSGPRTALFNPWRADLISAYASTGIADIDTYSVVPQPLASLMRLDAVWPALVRSQAVQRLLQRQVATQARGPSASERAAGRTAVYGEIENLEGQRVAARLFGPEAYRFSAQSAVLAARLVLQGQHRPGYRTPAEVFGPDALLSLPDVRREQV
ncbi:saccharopine dehydrogenase family protein [Deinococcus ruber]|uniref:Saccharopine dehydrogenase n=1 Tax=Deinococcus ruber TaxID=1848197 RepID=A0A918KV67_9DEIO|nr:saccharopine dehydrogenase NADP-binding domain-containing protein [Deinococcus ruber]GGR34729.1 saccharopine dehydrogenase [Deinococcus ruber]